MAISKSSFGKVVNVEKILMRTEYSENRNDGYYELLAQKIITFTNEVEFYGLEIGNGLSKLLEAIDYDTQTILLPLIMAGNSSEAKAAMLFTRCDDEVTWKKYFPMIEEDHCAQKHLIELINLTSFISGMNILVYWGKSLLQAGNEFEPNFFEQIEDNFWEVFPMISDQKYAFPLYVQYSIQHRGMSPKEVILEFLRTKDFKDLLNSLVSAYKPNQGNIELDIKVATMAFNGISESTAKEILLKVMFEFEKTPEKGMTVLKAASKYSSLGSGFKSLVVEMFFKVETVEGIQRLEEKVIEKLFQCGHLEAFRGIDENLPQEAVMKIGELAARNIAQIICSPLKYPWINATYLDSLIKIVVNIINNCQLTFEIETPITAALDFAFAGGKIMEFYSRYNYFDSMVLESLLELESSRGYYGPEKELFFALKELIGKLGYIEDEMNDILSENMKGNELALWKQLFSNTVKPKNPRQ